MTHRELLARNMDLFHPFVEEKHAMKRSSYPPSVVKTLLGKVPSSYGIPQ